jgi:hypothetical protein
MLATFEPPAAALHGHPEEEAEGSDSSDDSFVTAIGSVADEEEAVTAAPAEAATATTATTAATVVPAMAVAACATAATAEAATTKAAAAKAVTANAAPAQTPPAKAEAGMTKAAPAEAPEITAARTGDPSESGSENLPWDGTLEMVVAQQTQQAVSGAGWPIILPHAPPEWAEMFRDIMMDARFGASLSEDLAFDASDSDWDFWQTVASLMMEGGIAGYIGQAG